MFILAINENLQWAGLLLGQEVYPESFSLFFLAIIGSIFCLFLHHQHVSYIPVYIKLLYSVRNYPNSSFFYVSRNVKNFLSLFISVRALIENTNLSWERI